MKDIFEIAKEAGFMQHLGVICVPNHLALERFAALVIANHPPQSYMTWQEGYEAGKQAEREVIAQSLDKQADLACDEIDRQWAQEMAAAVRARGETK